MFWKHRVDLREVVQPLNKLSEKELNKNLPQIIEALAEKLEYASVFRKSNFPQRLRTSVKTSSDLQTFLEEMFDFADQEKVWLGVENFERDSDSDESPSV